MKTLARNIVLLALLVFQFGAHAEYKVLIQGIVVSFNEQVLVLRQEGNKTLNVPSSSLADKRGLMPGSANVMVYVSPADLLRLNPRLKKM